MLASTRTYDFKTKPYEHQAVALKTSCFSEYYALYMEMGTGKSKVIVDTMASLFEAGHIDTVLILAPKGVYDNWVRAEIPRHLPDRVHHNLVRWQNNLTKKFIAEMQGILYPATREAETLHTLVMNIEAMSTKKGASTVLKYLKNNPKNLLVVDESTAIKNHKALRTKNIIKAAQFAKYRRILTGSPITKSPMDLYSQCTFLSPKALGFKSFYAFRNRYARMQQRHIGPRSIQEIVGYQRLDELNEKLNRFSLRTLKKDCLDLPEKIYMRRDVPLTVEQERLYRQMKKLALAQFDQGELATTSSVLTQIMRLQQITCGFLKPDNGEIEEIKNNRLDELMAVVEELQGKAIIWASWTHDIVRIDKALRRRFGDEAAASYFGETEQKHRQEIVEKFQDPDSELRFFVGQPRTGGFGLTLSVAQTVIYFSNSYDLEIRLQSEDRAHRIGQENNVTYIDLVTPDTIDEKILQALRDKINISSQVLGEKAREWLI